MKKLLLAERGQARLPISITREACPGQERAAGELARYLRRITGADFAIARGTQPEGAIALAIEPSLEEEAFCLEITDRGISIAGGSLRGLFYGVYGFLEDVLGVGLYTHDVTKIPWIPHLELEAATLWEKPALEYRQLDGTLEYLPDWRAHNRLNAARTEAAGVPVAPLDRYGGGKSYALFVHTFDTLVPAAQYFDEHPEYFSMIDGKRQREETQLCLTNPEVLALVIKRVRQTLRAHPEAAIISVSQNDSLGDNGCTCPACAKVDEEEGSHAGTLIRFVNAVAEAIEDEFPHVLVDTLAYRYTRTPPKITRPRRNVCVRLCSIECCFGHPLEECNRVVGPFARWHTPGAPTFQDDLIGWGKICDRVYIWDYVTNFAQYWLPFPNFHVIGPNIRFFVKNGVKGVYEEGNYHSPSPDLNELRQWLLAKLMWNPDFDVKRGIYDFTEAVYGPAAEEIRAYIDLLEKRVTEGEIHFGIYERADVAYLDEETLSRAQELMSAARAKELTLSQRNYVEKAALSVEYAVVAQALLRGQRDVERIDAMMDKARALGITELCEFLRWDEVYDQMLGYGHYARNLFTPTR